MHEFSISSTRTAIVITLLAVVPTSVAGQEAKIRPAYRAGSWYPEDPKALTEQIDGLIAKASAVKLTGKPLAIIAPHAGYRFSAPVAASAYRCLQGHKYKRVIVMAFSHQSASRYTGVDVPRDLSAYHTPLGDVPLDRVVCDALLADPKFASHDNIDVGEHSLELQIPFLQRALGEFQLVPLLVGRMQTADYAQAAEAILPFLDDETLLVASSDFTHFGPRFAYTPFSDDLPTKLKELADQGAAPILACDFDGFLDHLAKTQDTICGRGPISLLLRILSMHEGAVGVRAGFDTSGRITDDWSNSVTYQSIVFTRPTGTLAQPVRDRLLTLARQTVAAHLSNKPIPNLEPDTLPPELRADGACFVTLENQGQLRGCIGNMVANGPLHESVIRNAVSACRDRRFAANPVTLSELGAIDIEISYLTPMKKVTNVEDIIVGRHGLMIELGYRRGVLLPQVASRRGWMREEFLQHTCNKAGLPPDAWKRPDATLYSFEAEVFGEEKHAPESSGD